MKYYKTEDQQQIVIANTLCTHFKGFERQENVSAWYSKVLLLKAKLHIKMKDCWEEEKSFKIQIFTHFPTFYLSISNINDMKRQMLTEIGP